MKGQVAKKGDRAVIVPHKPWKIQTQYIGTICDVLSDPEAEIFTCACCRYLSSNLIQTFDGFRGHAHTADLIPLPPDEEAHRLFAEQSDSKPKETEKV